MKTMQMLKAENRTFTARTLHCSSIPIDTTAMMVKAFFTLLAASTVVHAMAFPQRDGVDNAEDNNDNSAARHIRTSTTLGHYPTSTRSIDKYHTTTSKYHDPKPTSYDHDTTTCAQNSLATPGVLTVRLHNERRCQSNARNQGRRVDYQEEVFIESSININNDRRQDSNCVDVDDDISSASFQRFFDDSAFDRCTLNFFNGRRCASGRLARSIRINDNNERDCLNVGNGNARSLRVVCDN